MCSDLVKVVVRRAGRPPSEVVANLEDISPSGALLQLDDALGEGADVELFCSQWRVCGKVRYCRLTEIGYDAGVKFNESGAWDRKRFEPKHLLNVPVGNAVRRFTAGGPGGV
jgi:hypothetical protein